MPANTMTDHDSNSRTRRYVMWGAVGLFILAGVLRGVNHSHIDLWEDEVFTYIGSTNLVPDLIRWEGERSNLHAPLPYLEAKVSRALLGKSNIGMRMPAIVYGTATVLLLYFVVGHSLGFVVGFFAAFFLAMNPFALEWSRDARMYSQWMFGALLLIAFVQHVVSYAKSNDDGMLNWRWWFLGMLLMLVHAWAIFGVTTIAAVALWLGAIGLLACVKDYRVGRRIIGGAAISGGVYLFSWSSVGLAGILTRMSGAKKSSGTNVADRFVPELSASLSDLTGYLPHVGSAVLWVLAITGIVLAARKRLGLAALVVMIGTMSALTFPTIAKQHFFAARYVIVMLLPLSLGVGVSLAWLWDRSGRLRIPGRLGGCGVMVVLIFMWAPVDREVLSVPKLEYEKALANIRQNVREGDVLICVPEWYFELDRWFEFKGKAKVVYPPIEAALFAQKYIADGEMPKRVDALYRTVFTDGGSAKTPTVTWVLLVGPTTQSPGVSDKDRIDTLARLFKEYGLSVPEARKQLATQLNNARVLSFRLSKGTIDHIVAGAGRDISVWR